MKKNFRVAIKKFLFPLCFSFFLFSHCHSLVPYLFPLAFSNANNITMRRNADNITLETAEDVKLVIIWMRQYQDTETFPLTEDVDKRREIRKELVALIGKPTSVDHFVAIAAEFDLWGRDDNKATFIGKLMLCCVE